tara:strand:- start:619 stop:1422 length:804 start_codon:yes stop_codon:yes gene_type:complete
MITRVNPITQINDKLISNGFVLGQLTADYDDSTAITSIAVTRTLIDLKDGDKFLISGQEFTVAADTAANSASITIDSVTPSIPVQIGESIEINQDNLFVQYQRKSEGTIAGMPVDADELGPIKYESGVYSILGVDPTYVKILPRDFLVNDDASSPDITPAIFNDGTNTGVSVENTSQELIATVNIPFGTTATEVKIWGSNTTKSVEVYAMDISANGKGSTIGTGTTNGSAITITSTAATTTNYIMIKILVSSANHRIWGGNVTLTQN